MNMKIILNRDISPLGEEGDVKEVAKGYARNFLFPRRIAVPYTERTVKLFEARKDEIAERKAHKRNEASSLKDRLEALELSITMPAGMNGKLYGAVTSQSIMDELAKHGFPIERKRIEIPGNSIKSVGKYKFTVKLYGNATAELSISVIAQEIKTTVKETHSKERRRRANESRHETEASGVEAASGGSAEASGVEAASGGSAETSGVEAASGGGAEASGVEAASDGSAASDGTAASVGE